jgi:hydroxymethylglutaryl-CoA lyase
MLKSESSARPAIRVYEVGPRDGLQNESQVLSVQTRLALIEQLAAAGLRQIEIGSFVRPDRIPALADTEHVAHALNHDGPVAYAALVPNHQGLERAVASGLREVALFMSASERHNRSNTNRSIADSLRVYAELSAQARAQGLRVRAYLSTVFGCPYEGPVAAEQVLPLVEQLLALGVYEVSLGDTIGVASPRAIEQMLSVLLPRFGPNVLALHLHDTRGTALANVLRGLQMGITCFDAAVGGIGGCPYAPGASGNLASEDLIYMLHDMGFATGVDLNALVKVNHFLSRALGKPLNSKYALTCPEETP